MLYKKILGIGLITLLFASCLGDKVDLTDQKLEGRWEITQAFREGRETRTLKDGFFDFTSPDQFRTNILNDEQNYKYRLSGNKIIVESNPIVNYTVLQMLSDT
ncbi:MAG: hypothetical protein HKN09_12155, partial [Saprospiraceae bacterium]|nr:hypothetical protein [Saprospiraceae bacterium]